VNDFRNGRAILIMKTMLRCIAGAWLAASILTAPRGTVAKRVEPDAARREREELDRTNCVPLMLDASNRTAL